MKKITLIVLGCLMVQLSYGQFQEESKKEKRTRQQDEIQTLGGKETHMGGYGGLTFKTTNFRDETTMLMGLRGGWNINRSVAIGLEVNGIIPSNTYEDVAASPERDVRLVGGYGGLFVEPIFWSNKVVHLTVPIAAGGGWLGYHEDWDEINANLIDEDVFWYIEPGANAEFNVVKNFRIATGFSYRFTEDIELINTSANDFQGFNYYLTLKFGKF